MAQTVESEEVPASPDGERSFASGAKILSIGIASTGVFTFLYLATASHVLGAKSASYSRISICWAVMYVIVSVIYRPIEQLLSRTIADRHARGQHGHILRTPALIQASFATTFLIVALALHGEIANRLFDHARGLYWILVIGVMAYAASYFARGWLAGNKRFALYGGLVFLESTSRFVFAAVAAVGIAHAQNVIGAGMAAAPFVSLCVIPFAFQRVRVRAPQTVEVVDAGRGGPGHAGVEEAATDLSLRHGAGFAASVVVIMFSEQTLMNAGVIIVAANSGFHLNSGIAGQVFNVLLIVRAPLQLFQAIQTSILPHLTGMEARGSSDEFRRAIRTTLLVIAGFGAAVALGLLAIGPPVMKIATGYGDYKRFGLALVGVGMGLHLASGTLNQALLARGRAHLSAIAWLTAAAAFVIFIATHTIAAEITRVEVGYCGATGLLALMLGGLYRRSSLTGSRSAQPVASAVQ
jgi:O-antigen/teichoic acid export membrane protein